MQRTIIQSSQRDDVQYRGPTCRTIKAKILVNSSIVSGSLKHSRFLREKTEEEREGWQRREGGLGIQLGLTVVHEIFV